MDSLRRKSIEFIRRKSVDSQRRDSQRRKSTDGQGKKGGGTRSVGFWVEGQCLYPGGDTGPGDCYPEDSYYPPDPRRMYDRLALPDGGFISGRSLLSGQRSPNTVLR